MIKKKNIHVRLFQSLLMGSLLIPIGSDVFSQQKSDIAYESDSTYQSFMTYFEKVYDFMDVNYYKDVDRKEYDRFIGDFNKKIYSQLKNENKSDHYIQWRSAARLVDYLKNPEDIFSALYPPKPAKEYEQTVLGKRIDLGIEGKFVDGNYLVTHLEPRSDAYSKGLRMNNVIVKLNGRFTRDLEESEVDDVLNPLEGEEVSLTFYDNIDRIEKYISVVSQEYFKQTVFSCPVSAPNVYCLEIRRFNRKTSDDMFRHLEFFRQYGSIDGLIIDLRDNPGGPPLAAREISAFFLPPGNEFAYFQKKGHAPSNLDVPTIPEKYHYSGPMVILINNKSGSAAELFSGILQKRNRAVLMGKNSAGQVFLKSMFHFDDESMLLLITARGHHPDGKVFPFSGLIPDRFIDESDKDIIQYATTYLMYINQKLNLNI